MWSLTVLAERCPGSRSRSPGQGSGCQDAVLTSGAAGQRQVGRWRGQLSPTQDTWLLKGHPQKDEQLQEELFALSQS